MNTSRSREKKKGRKRTKKTRKKRSKRKLVARGFRRVLRCPPLLRRLMVQPIK